MRASLFSVGIGASLAAVGLAVSFILDDFSPSKAVRTGSEPQVHGDTQPAHVSPIPGTQLSRVSLTERAAERLAIATDTVRATTGSQAGSSQTVIPYGAIIYDAEGATWTYTNPEPLVYVRHSITIHHIDQEVALLSAGPPVGTRVVTTGAAELFGAEFGIGK